jgi:ABC-type Fe3+/spermidine/putrescine transport system ATPase subunit
VVVLVRPENIVLHTQPPGSESPNILSGTVQTITFLGPITRVTVSAGGERIVADLTAANRAALVHGQKVWLSFGPDACQVMER